MITRRGGAWYGSESGDLDEYLAYFSEPGARVRAVAHASCPCGGARFAVRVDDEEGCAERTCAACGTVVLVLDSADTASDAHLEEAACPCGGEEFETAVGYAMHDDGEVRWTYLGLRCTADGLLGVYADWKIDYSPSRHLLDRA